MNDQTKTDEATADPVVASDISDFDTVAGADAGAVMEVRSPKTGDVLRHEDGRPFTITYHGQDSEAVRSISRAQNDRRAQQNARTRSPIMSASIERDDIELLVAATMKWDVVLGGTVPPSNQASYRAAYTKYPWLKDQGDQFVGVRANFIPASRLNSSKERDGSGGE
jgi:hypothetical protein